MSFEEFSSVSPFVLVRPWSTNAMKISEVRDVVIFMPGASTILAVQNQAFVVLCSTLESFAIDSDGNVTPARDTV